MTPADGIAQRPLPVGEIRRPTREERQPSFQALQER
jgi:hypothetical protein